jgi:ligand-binding SRPBCC domain-containing protein
LERETWVPRPVEEVFDFFSRVENLEALTPDSLGFQILTPLPIEMRKGQLIEYRLKFGLLTMRWQSIVSSWEPPWRFVDDQLKGPYRKWSHEHTFEEIKGGTMVRDYVQYEVPGWFLEPLVHAVFVAPRLRAIFDHRARAMRTHLG